jgi:hypothetical protein
MYDIELKKNILRTQNLLYDSIFYPRDDDDDTSSGKKKVFIILLILYLYLRRCLRVVQDLNL